MSKMPADSYVLQQLKDNYQTQRQALFEQLNQPDPLFRRALSSLKLFRDLAAVTDDLLRQLWQHHGLHKHDAALAAVGGYGRAELLPYSDIDVLILLDEAADTADSATHQAVTTFIGSCWDLGLQIGSSVRTVAQCVAASADDITVQTALLERRFIGGNQPLFDALDAAYDSTMHPYAFYLDKTLEMRQRYAKFDNTPYALEPNCKESPGGLRDLHTIIWVAKAAGFGHTWKALADNGLITRHEANQCHRCHALLNVIRARLHLTANRCEDRLIFDLQTSVAEKIGYHYTPATATQSAVRPSEALMRRYYWTAKAVTQLGHIVLLNIGERLRDAGHTRDNDPAPVTKAMLALQAKMHTPRVQTDGAPKLEVVATVNPVSSTATPLPDFLAPIEKYELKPLNEHFFDKNGWLEVASDDLYIQNPHAILETFLVLEQHVGLNGLSVRTMRALYNSRSVMNSTFRADPINRKQFLAILQAPSGVTHVLRLMNQTSVLGRYLWSFRKIVGQMQHDLFHAYTVDQHILMVVRNIRRFFKAEHAHEYPLCSQLAAEWDSPWILSTAALFHDIAKGRGGDHSVLGEQEMRRFCKQHGIGEEDTNLLAFLVREHLTMSHVAQKQDISNPDVIKAFAQRMGSERYLTGLYLLTVADIRGTSTKVWNGWKGKLLEDLYHTTLRALGGHQPDENSLVETHKREALIEMARFSMPYQGHVALWNTLDVAYFMRHDANTIAWQTRQVARYVGQNKTIVRARLSPHGEGLQVLVYCPDQADLFARICSYFDQESLSILDAKIHTTSDGCALDSFLVVTNFMEDHYREFLTMIENSLTRVLETQQPLPAPSQGRVSRRVKLFPIAPSIQLQPDDKKQNWLLTINTSDRVGLLYRIANALSQHQIQIQFAKIATMGERVEDTFLIRGAALSSEKQRAELEGSLQAMMAV